MKGHEPIYPTNSQIYMGMSTRDELAKSAMQSILQSSKAPLEYYLSEKLMRDKDAQIIAANAYKMADAMIAQSEK